MSYKICSIGECMIELTNIDNKNYSLSVAGDTLNFCFYLKKELFNVFYFTAIGNSEMSKEALYFFQKNNINTQLVHKDPKNEIGLYIIKNTKSGEKQFYYWRDNSAAKYYLNNLNIKNMSKKIQNFDFLYLSGITLSLIEKKNLNHIINFIDSCKSKNCKVIFDLNIRIKRWNKKNLLSFLKIILLKVDILFASGEDIKLWKGNDKISTFLDIIKKNKILHGVYRKNAKYNYSFLQKNKFIVQNKLLNKVVDTSGAGDGYNATYLSSFIHTNDPKKALKAASKIGAKIIMKKGAIVDVK
jgi:2-dehydro-3-deoxygluconokinase